MDVDEAAACGRAVAAGREQADVIGHRRAAEPCHPQPHIDRRRIAELGEIVASRLYHQIDGRPAMRIETDMIQQPAIHRRVHQLVMNRVVQMPVDVVVVPAGMQPGKKGIISAR